MNQDSQYNIFKACIEHSISRLGMTKTICDPYPHFWVDEILSSAIYDRLLTELPDSSLYADLTTKTDYQNRAICELRSENIDLLSPSSAELWYGIRQFLASEKLKRCIFEKLARGFARRFNIAEEEAANIPAFVRPALYQELKGYSIAPHPDTRRKLATVQFALTDDPGQVDLGTSIYQLSVNPKHLLQTPRGFCEVKRYPFSKNSVFAFSVVNTISMKSWHGRAALPDDGGVRNTLLQVYFAHAKDGNQEIYEEETSRAA